MRFGQGWDVHRIVPGRPLILGGVTIPCDFGLEGHSDADVLAHAITDAILGAIANLSWFMTVLSSVSVICVGFP